MSALDWLVLLGTTLGIAAYGWWRTRGGGKLDRYLRGAENTSWITIGLSVMATQASAVTFISTPGQGYADGMRFVQIYFGLPIAMVIIAAVFVPLYRRLNVFTAYEFLGRRFDGKTRLLGAGLFLVQRGIGAGLTIYAPSIVISGVLGWSLNLTIILSAAVAIIYTVSGGSEAVNVTHKFQMVLIFSGLIVAFCVIVAKLPHGVSLGDALHVAGSAGRMKAIDFSHDLNNRYTIWSGIFGGVFLMLSYFGTDQSQVQRYLSGTSVRESRLGLMFNGVVKIPMQIFILSLGALVFAFYQFERPPVFFNRVEWRKYCDAPGGEALRLLDERFAASHADQAARVHQWLDARHSGDPSAESTARAAMLAAGEQTQQLRAEATKTLASLENKKETKDTDYVFLTFILDHLPHGVIGLLVAVICAGGLSSVASELTALGTTMTVDFYRNLVRPDASDAHCLVVSKWFTAAWGVLILGFAFCFQFADNLIQAVNLIGSIFYGPVLGLFIVAFFFKRVGGTAVFWGALGAQALVIAIHLFASDKIAFLWYNPIGVATCILLSYAVQALPGISSERPKPSLAS